MAQDEGFFNRRKTFLNNNIQVNNLQSLYYIDKIMNSSRKTTNNKTKCINTKIKNKQKKTKRKVSEEEIKYNKIIDTNEKINRKITDYISSII